MSTGMRMGINSLWKLDLTIAFIQLLKREKLNYINPLIAFQDQKVEMKVDEWNSSAKERDRYFATTNTNTWTVSVH